VLLRIVLWVTLFLSSAITTVGQPQTSAERLIQDLGCGSCHPGVPAPVEMREKAPDLRTAGLRYEPAYLFDFLQNPTRVRQHIGAARMPDFHLSERERLALVLFLETQTQVEGEWPEYPDGLSGRWRWRLGRVSSEKAKALIVDKLQCTKCHALTGQGENQSTDLTTVAYRLRPEWVRQYLVAPYIFDGPKTRMPAFFYQLQPDQNQFTELLPQAAESIDTITRYLFSLDDQRRKNLQKAYEKARKAHPDVTAEMGARIFRSQNCGACHRSAFSAPGQTMTGPDLSMEGVRVRREWLRGYLKRPWPVRPFGFQPGTGSRMPDFRLSEEEVALITEYLLEQGSPEGSTPERFRPRRLSAFSMKKARTLLQEKLSCLGCHRLGGEGGRIGPDLSSLNTRLRADFVYNMVKDPAATVPGTVMPKVPMPAKTLELIVSYLLQQRVRRRDSTYLSLIDHPVDFYERKGGGEDVYRKYCAACHGGDGNGNGYNARYLPTAPTSHADSTAMASRPDDTLFDGIYAGGYILNKSPMMPPWGATLDSRDIWSLVRFIRKLCNCQGPEWSRDNK
jgi:mono/diheme cytochrome c family protein